jgi:hypothetical protein
MANQKIHEYPLERFVYGDDDYYDIDYWDGSVYQTAKILGSTIKAAMLSGIAINLTAPAAFIVGGSPTDGTGTLTLTAAGLANQYIRGDGTLATFPTSGGGGNSVNYYLNGGTAASVATYYQMSKTAIIGTGVDFSLAGNGLISQWLTDVGDPNVTEIPSGNWNFEMFFSASSGGGVPKFYVELLKYSGGIFTTIANNSLAPEPITSGTAIDLYLTSLAVPFTSLAVGDRLAIRVYIVDSVLGRTIINHTQNSHLCQIITTFSSGLSSINGLTEQTQYLAVGTSGTDFAINSATDTHTFNLPTASATNRGALSSANWSTFNGKQNAITLTTTGSGAATFIADTLNIPTASGGTPAGITGQIQFNNAGSFGADSALFWDNTNKRLGIGATPATTVRLDVRAQGALSTDIAFRVRNSADTLDIIRANGAGDVFVGLGAGRVNTGANNSFVGQNAGYNNTTGGKNTANGVNSLYTNTTGVDNTAIGYNALQNNTTAGGNTGIGSYALQNNTLGTGNTATGSVALLSNTTGFANTANGFYALYANTIGGKNTAIGHNALYSNTTGNDGIAHGYNALQNNTTGNSNTANGSYALLSNTTGSSNTANGSISLYSNTTGSNNTAQGLNSGRFIADGTTANAITNNSVYIGNETKALANNQTNQIVIGYNAIGAGSNTATLGNTSIVKTILRGTLNAANLPTSATGLVTGDIWNNLGILTIV